MLTITLPKEGINRQYETARLRELVAGGKLCVNLWGEDKGEDHFELDCYHNLKQAKKVSDTWADDDTEIILRSGKCDPRALNLPPRTKRACTGFRPAL